ncbi:4-alpha-glucanotransferase [Tsuneonella sp. SYSU-LHT278]|uniref:4-alpha-glucanotransferase n=1 Tax=Tsuneonella sediminis TaxID=3416089 RepID=UPI003F79A156
MSDATLEAILAGLGDDAADEEATGALPPMVVADAGERITLPLAPSCVEVTGEDGRTARLEQDASGALAPRAPGYYDLEWRGQTAMLAVAPARAPGLTGESRLWGAAIQIPALRSSRPAPFGGFGELANAVRALADTGAAAVAINPVHALFPGEGRDFSPYSPSSRIFLNGAMADPELAGLAPFPLVDGPPLIDWETAMPAQLANLRAAFATLDAATRERMESDPAMNDPALVRHAIFDALYLRFAPSGARGWQDWPPGYRDPDGPDVARFARENGEQVAFHLFVQWLAREGLASSQRAARAAGMEIGLIADLAVGVSPMGSDCWSLRDAMLRGLTVGAPPDPLGPQGQNWHLSTFSPSGLRRTGYAPFIAMLRAGFAEGGGLRVDHAFGLQRLWVVPDGASATEGAYLAYPFDDLVRLLTLEAHRARAIVIAEDLGTSPSGFTDAISQRGLYGMEVLWFARARDHGFRGAHDYRPTSVAMTGTHDTPTVAGWWTGRDIEWAERCGRIGPNTSRKRTDSVREWDRGLLWSTIGRDAPRPAPDQPGPVVDAALAHVAASPSPLAIVPLEDLLAETEQPNLPGATVGHPNWRRRTDAPLNDLLEAPAVAARTAVLSSRGA